MGSLPPRSAFVTVLLAAACGDRAPVGSDAAPAVVLNEVECDDPEWIELANPGAGDVDLAGWTVTDGPGDSRHVHVLPAGTWIAAGGHRVLPRQTADADGFTFGLECGKDRLSLVRPDGSEADVVELPAHPWGHAWGRVADATGAWRETDPTPGVANQPATDPAAMLFEPAEVFLVDITLDEAAVLSLAAYPRAYVAGTLAVARSDSTSLFGPAAVGVRLKGGYGSFRPLEEKAAFKLNLDHVVDGQRFLGLEHLTLNNMVQDPTMIHEVVAYAVFRRIGVPAPRVGYAWVRVNGEDFGLYANVETPDDVFLGKHLHSTAHLYEGEYGTDVTPGAPYDVDEGDADDTSDLDALVAAAAAPPGAWIDAVGAVADLEEMTRVWAAEIYLGHWDGYAPSVNNYRLHADEDGVFTMLPWGTDQTFDARLGFFEGQGRLWAGCRADAECRTLYVTALAEVLAAVDALALDAWILELRENLAPWIAIDPRRPYGEEEAAWWVQGMREFLETRADEAADAARCATEDADGDGHVCAVDCRDDDPGIHPGAEEICPDGIDQDCSGRPDDAEGCPICWEVALGPRRYLPCVARRGWREARELCQEHGGDLLVLDAPAEEAALTAAIPQFEWLDCWLGVSDEANEGEWLTVHGTPPTWTAWSSGQPDDWEGIEDCAERWGPFAWNDLACWDERAVFCERPCTSGAIDADGDGHASNDTCGWDCDDANPLRHPGAIEHCGDGVDQDCDGEVDEGC